MKKLNPKHLLAIAALSAVAALSATGQKSRDMSPYRGLNTMGSIVQELETN